MVNTADATQVAGYSPRLAGNGLVQPLPATLTSVVARGDSDAPSLSLGVQQFSSDFAGGGDVTLNNNGASDAIFNISVVQEAASSSRAQSVTVDPSVTVPAGGSARVHVGVSIPAATAGDSAAFRQVAGRIVLTPASGADNGGVTLSVPYYAVPRVRSVVASTIDPGFSPTNGTTAHISNTSAVTGTAAFYDWGLSGTHSNFGEAGLRAVGAQGFTSGGNQVIRFAVNTLAPWSYAGAGNLEFDIHIAGPDGNHYTVFSEDFGRATAGAPNGQVASIVVNDVTHAGFIDFLATAPTDGTTILLPILASRVGVNAANPRFTYSAESFHFADSGLDNDVIAGPASFNAFTNAITSSVLTQTVTAGGSANVPLSVNAAEFAQTPAKGEMIVARDNFSGASQAQLLPILQSIDVAPGTASILPNQTQQFNATGHFSDGSMQDVTTSTSWDTSDHTIATIGMNTGLASPVAP